MGSPDCVRARFSSCHGHALMANAHLGPLPWVLQRFRFCSAAWPSKCFQPRHARTCQRRSHGSTGSPSSRGQPQLSCRFGLGFSLTTPSYHQGSIGFSLLSLAWFGIFYHYLVHSMAAMTSPVLGLWVPRLQRGPVQPWAQVFWLPASGRSCVTFSGQRLTHESSPGVPSRLKRWGRRHNPVAVLAPGRLHLGNPLLFRASTLPSLRPGSEASYSWNRWLRVSSRYCSLITTSLV